MELPTGYVADRIGYRRALAIGASLWVVGWGFYVIARSFGGAVAAEIALGAGMAFISGSDSALLWVSLPGDERALVGGVEFEDVADERALIAPRAKLVVGLDAEPDDEERRHGDRRGAQRLGERVVVCGGFHRSLGDFAERSAAAG